MDNENAPQDSTATALAETPGGFWLRSGACMIDALIISAVVLTAGRLLSGTIGAVFRLLLTASYFTFLPVYTRGQTLGKMLAGVAIVRTDGSPLTYGRALARWIGYVLSALTVMLGFLCAVFTPNKRALHDYIAGTRIVRVEELGTARKVIVTILGVLLPLLIALDIFSAFMFQRLLAQEIAARMRLDDLRAAVAADSKDAKALPSSLNALIPKYVTDIPPANVERHPGVSGVEIYGAEVCSGSKQPGADILGEKLRDTGKWGYVVAPGAPCNGRVFIDCTHDSLENLPWYAF